MLREAVRGRSCCCDDRTSLGSQLRVCHPPDFTHYDYPGIYEDQNFHHCGLEPNDTIVNYDNEIEVWTCELDGMAEYASFFGAPPLSMSTLTCRALAWRRRQTTSAGDLPSIRTIFSPWGLMVCGWMQPSVSRTFPHHETFYAHTMMRS